MIIVIQGCDKTGKTTLAKKLAQMHNLKYIHVTKPKTDNPQQEYIDIILNNDNVDIVVDRLHIGQNVYGPLYRNTQIRNFEKLQNLLLQKEAICIHATNSVQNITNLFEIQNQDFAKKQHVQIIVNKFKQQIQKSKLYWIEYIKQKNFSI